ncbi:NUDIX domain-containing protein [Streptomyces roseoverticillatus]|nr:NUDIX domain-containing protein [Streptomyces roseoverticillatus]
MAAGALFFNDKGHVLLVRPSYKPKWEIPGGYIEEGESPLAACRREVEEGRGSGGRSVRPRGGRAPYSCRHGCGSVRRPHPPAVAEGDRAAAAMWLSPSWTHPLSSPPSWHRIRLSPRRGLMFRPPVAQARHRERGPPPPARSAPTTSAAPPRSRPPPTWP